MHQSKFQTDFIEFSAQVHRKSEGLFGKFDCVVSRQDARGAIGFMLFMD